MPAKLMPTQRTATHPEFDFCLVLSGITDFTDEQVDALCEAGCDDATISQQHGRVYMDFSRQAATLADAIISAVRDVKQAGIGASVQRVDSCNLVTQAEIARRIDRSRQAVLQYIKAERGPGGFPAPACNLTEGAPLWYWCEVAHWLADHNLIQAEASEQAQEVAAINAVLELEHLKKIAPGITQGLLEQFNVTEPA